MHGLLGMKRINENAVLKSIEENEAQENIFDNEMKLSDTESDYYGDSDLDDEQLFGAFFRTLWCHMAKETTPNDWEEAGTISIEIQVPEAVRPLLKFFANVVGEDYAEFESFVFSELVKVGFSEKAIKVETELEEGMLICDIKKYEYYQ